MKKRQFKWFLILLINTPFLFADTAGLSLDITTGKGFPAISSDKQTIASVLEKFAGDGDYTKYIFQLYSAETGQEIRVISLWEGDSNKPLKESKESQSKLKEANELIETLQLTPLLRLEKTTILKTKDLYEIKKQDGSLVVRGKLPERIYDSPCCNHAVEEKTKCIYTPAVNSSVFVDSENKPKIIVVSVFYLDSDNGCHPEPVIAILPSSRTATNTTVAPSKNTASGQRLPHGTPNK